MGFVRALTGKITVAASSDLKTLIEAVKPFDWRLSITAPETDTVGADDPTIINSRNVGPYSWSATVRARFPAGGPVNGAGCDIVFSSGDDTFPVSWRLDMECEPEPPFVSMSDAGATATQTGPGPVRWGGSYSVRMNDAAAMTLPATPNAAGAAATFKLTDEGAGTDNTFAGSIRISGASPSLSIPGSVGVEYTFVGTGNLTAAGDSPLLPAGTVGTPDTTEIVFDYDGTRTLTGDAFWSSISVVAEASGELIIEITLTGTGALTAG